MSPVARCVAARQGAVVMDLLLTPTDGEIAPYARNQRRSAWPLSGWTISVRADSERTGGGHDEQHHHVVCVLAFG